MPLNRDEVIAALKRTHENISEAAWAGDERAIWWLAHVWADLPPWVRLACGSPL